MLFFLAIAPMIVAIVVFMTSVGIGNLNFSNIGKVVKWSIAITIFCTVLYYILALSFFAVKKIDEEAKLLKTEEITKYEQKLKTSAF